MLDKAKSLFAYNLKCDLLIVFHCFQHVGDTEKGNISEWCNTVWRKPHIFEMKNLMVGGLEKPLHIW
jgi:hypothetical protein